MKKNDVLVAGELNIDIILDEIDGFPEIGKEILSDRMTVTLGSSSAILASNLAVLGSEVAFMGKIGDDSFGKLILQTLNTKKVNTGSVITQSNLTTGATIVLNYDKDRANITFPGAMDHLSSSEITDEILIQSKHLHVSSIFMQKGLKDGMVNLFERAKKLGLTTSIDPQWDPNEDWEIDLKSLLPHVDVFLPNRKEFMFLTKSKSIEEGIEHVKDFVNILIIKDGENGAHLYIKDHFITKPAYFNPNISDCIGAGDSFNAGFLSKFTKGFDLEHCLDFANMTGAVNTTNYGGTTAFKSLAEVEKIAKSQFNYQF